MATWAEVKVGRTKVRYVWSWVELKLDMVGVELWRGKIG